MYNIAFIVYFTIVFLLCLLVCFVLRDDLFHVVSRHINKYCLQQNQVFEPVDVIFAG